MLVVTYFSSDLEVHDDCDISQQASQCIVQIPSMPYGSIAILSYDAGAKSMEYFTNCYEGML